MPPPLFFADTFYWIALTYPRDAFHSRVLSFSNNLGVAELVTTDEVFTEVLSYFSRMGPVWRGEAATTVQDARNDPGVHVLPQTRADFDAALRLYETRLDKGYSLTDCRSMNAMRSRGTTEILTNDRHFTQEGFTILFP